MSRLRLELLGGFQAAHESGTPFRLRTRKSEALLAYLAVAPGRFHSRDKLAALLWEAVPEAQARQSLRQALGSLRRALGSDGASIVLTQGDAIGLDPARVSVDVLDLQAALAHGQTKALEQVADLYKGDFLAGFRLNEAPFEEWRTVERERLHELALEGLVRLLGEQVRAERVVTAIQTAQRILALDPLQEPVHRTLMRLLLRQGRRAMALQQYQVCVTALLRELGAEPDEQTRGLYREILQTTRPGADRPGAGPAAPRGSAAGSRVVEAPMIGRVAEREHLQDTLTRALDEGGHLVLVSGEAGIGKSRLVQEFASSDALRAFRICLGRCHETEQTLPFRPWVEALRGDGATLEPAIRDRIGAATAGQLADLFPELRPPAEARPPTGAVPALLFDPLLELLGALASEQPLVLIVEDLHWADTMSARFLAFLARRVQRWPVLVVATTRPEELIDAPALVQALTELRAEGRLDELLLGPLSETESRELVRALQPTTRSGQDREQLEREIWDASEGSPFVIVESIRSLQQGAPRTVGRRVQDFVAARLDRLADAPRHCVAVAATIGRDFTFALLARAAGLGEREAADAIEELVRRRVLDSVGDRLDFCHDWIRLVAYERLLPARRGLLHAAVGEALEELHRDRLDDVADQLGNHYSSAGDFGRAVPRLIRFGRLAVQRYALDDAQRALAQAMAGVGQLPPTGRERWRLEVALEQAFVLSVMGRQREILELLQAHEGDLARLGDSPLAAEYYFRLGLTHFFLGQWSDARRAAESALAHGERRGDAEAIGKALHVLSLHAYNSRPAEGIAHATRAIALLDQPHTQAWLGLVWYDLQLNHIVAGDLVAATAAGRQVTAIGRRSQMPRLLAFAGFGAAWIHVLRGEFTLAIEAARSALEVSRDGTVGGLLAWALGCAHLEQGDAAAAVATLTESVDRLDRSPLRHALVRHLAVLGEAHLRAGDRDRGQEVAVRALDLGKADGSGFGVGLAQRTLGRISQAGGDLAAAEDHLGQALETFAAAAATFEAARTRVDLAAVLAARGDESGARDHLAAALAAFEAAAAPARAASARELAASLGLLLAPA